MYHNEMAQTQSILTCRIMKQAPLASIVGRSMFSKFFFLCYIYTRGGDGFVTTATNVSFSLQNFLLVSSAYRARRVCGQELFFSRKIHHGTESKWGTERE